MWFGEDQIVLAKSSLVSMVAEVNDTFVLALLAKIER